jgi:cytochrome c-type biogenesis protein CcmH
MWWLAVLLVAWVGMGLLGPAPSHASAIEPFPFRSDLEEQRYRSLLEELRCTVCQNQSLADSDAPLARDLRRELFQMLQQDLSDMEIRHFMVERYGDFVLYRPPLARHTILLWFGPVALLLVSLMATALVVRKRRQAL